MTFPKRRHVLIFRANVQTSPPSLISISIGQLLKTLKSSVDLQADLEALAESLDSTTLQRLLQDPRTPYPILHLLDALPSTTIKGSSSDRKIVDIDETVLAGEQYVRTEKPKCNDDYLVTLNDLSRLFGPPDENGIVNIQRKSPPKGGFEFVDEKRKPLLQIQGTHASFINTFDRVTQGILKGLDWSHVFVAGGMVLNTLLHTDPSRDRQGDVHECDIDLYLYDLTPEEANLKIKEMYQIWSTNHTNNSANAMNVTIGSEHIVIKNAKTINFVPTFPGRRIQIILKLLPSPLDILLNFDLDACAIGFDGSRVLMLPRCARAIETGYSVFTMDLVWGHHLGNRRETQEIRVFKYADRGFGLRILPSYVRSLGKQSTTGKLPSDDQTPSAAGAEATRGRTGPTRLFEGEAGLKTVRRIAHIAKDFLHRCYFGPPNVLKRRERRYGSSVIDFDIDDEMPDGVASVENLSDEDMVSDEGSEDNEDLPPIIRLCAIDGYNFHEVLPQGRKSLGGFELFMRHCEAWRLDAIGLARLDRASFASIGYDDLGTYDGLPTYNWNAFTSHEMERFVMNVNDHNNALFFTLRKVVGERLNIDPQQGRYVNYLTRRIRRLIVDRDFDSVQAKQLTMPLLIPMDLETHITNELAHGYDDLPENALSQVLIPAHDPSKHDPATATMPSLHDTVNESGNLRYWLISKKSMWAGQHRVLDEVSELLAALFDWFKSGKYGNVTYATDDPHCTWHLAEILRRRLILPETSCTLERGQTLPLREARLFRAWALARPLRIERSFDEDDWKMCKFLNQLAKDRDVADELFWKDGDEGTWDCEEGVPVWQA
ncbi:MAG: hypothetical protein LQ343_007581 [Gyalolechia ehrenbergii]|nr:MAG: hypothetical protein LQ343_007581 [Gyalolechia ehrenbergii]